MNLHENISLFKNAITATSQIKNTPEIYIEKDYWVTLALYSIFQGEIGKETVFKGGTALSKCNKLIDRFSEDIDIVLLRQGKESSNQLKNKLKKITRAVGKVIPEIEIEGITNKKGMIRKTAHSYKRTIYKHFGQIRDNIIVEATWRRKYEPIKKGTVTTLIYEMMIDTRQLEIAETYYNWRNPDGNYEDIKGFCNAASIERVKEFDYVLTPGRYVGLADEEDAIYPMFLPNKV